MNRSLPAWVLLEEEEKPGLEESATDLGTILVRRLLSFREQLDSFSKCTVIIYIEIDVCCFQYLLTRIKYKRRL